MSSSEEQPKWQAANGASLPKDMTESFTITAPPKTDIWRRADDDDVFNAPMVYQSMKASEFKKLELTVFAPWKTQYDQGGLFIAFPNSSSSSSSEGEDKASNAAAPSDKGPPTPSNLKKIKHIKAGIEFFSTASVLGIVGTDVYSDWSLSPMSASHHQKATFRAERDGTTLWIYAAQEGEEKRDASEVGGSEVLKPMREVKWAFMEGRDEAEIWVGAYAAKPTVEEAEEEKGIEVTFEGVKVVRSEE